MSEQEFQIENSQHIKTIHHKNSKCDSCGKSFSEAGTLKRHIQTVHEGHKNFNCKSCWKSFSQEGDSKKHIYTVHEGHKDNKCDTCGKSFLLPNI